MIQLCVDFSYKKKVETDKHYLKNGIGAFDYYDHRFVLG